MDKKESYLNGGIGFTPGSTVYTQFNDGIDFLITTDVHIDDMLKAMEKDAMEGNKGENYDNGYGKSITEAVEDMFGLEPTRDPEDIPDIRPDMDQESLPIFGPSASLDLDAEEYIESCKQLSSGAVFTEWSMIDLFV